MSFSLLPRVMVNGLPDITPEFLHSRSIRLLMLDFDNTIVPYTTCVPTEEMESWFAAMKESGIQLCIVSNSRKDRVPQFCREHDLPCITHARKPLTGGVRECLEKFQIPASQAALAGDQI